MICCLNTDNRRYLQKSLHQQRSRLKFRDFLETLKPFHEAIVPCQIPGTYYHIKRREVLFLPFKSQKRCFSKNQNVQPQKVHSDIFNGIGAHKKYNGRLNVLIQNWYLIGVKIISSLAVIKKHRVRTSASSPPTLGLTLIIEKRTYPYYKVYQHNIPQNSSPFVCIDLLRCILCRKRTLDCSCPLLNSFV